MNDRISKQRELIAKKEGKFYTNTRYGSSFRIRSKQCLRLGSNNHPLSIVDLPLTQEKVESTYADVFQGLGKFPGDPYKLRLKPDAVPAKHRPRKVPVHLQDTFHEAVE